MCKQLARRIIVIAMVVLFFSQLLLNETSWLADNPMAEVLSLYSVILWSVAVLVHVFWMNRKPFFSFFKRVPDLSRRGQLQIVVLLLLVFQVGVAVLGMEFLGAGTEIAITMFWWATVFVLLQVVHIWLNKRALPRYLGQRWAMPTLVLLGAGCIGITISGLVANILSRGWHLWGF